MSTKERFIDKIRALFALSKSSNQAEAEAALAKANELMEKYQISMADMAQREDGVVGQLTYEVAGFKTRHHFIYYFALAAGMLYDCRCAAHRDLGTNKFTYVGHETDIEAAVATFEYLWNAWNSIVLLDLDEKKAEAKDNFQRWAPKHTIMYKNSHGTGFANALAARVVDLTSARHLKVQQHSGNGRELVLAKSTAIDDYVKKNTKFERGKTKINIRSADGYGAGMSRGNEIPLNSVSGGGNGKAIAAIGRSN